MSIPILATKLFVPPPRKELVPRQGLIERLNQGVKGKLTLISGPAGFGKTTLLSEWAAQCQHPVAWLSLDEDDNDKIRFLAYFMAALKIVSEDFGDSIREALQAHQPPETDTLLSGLLNEITELQKPFVIVLDDLHCITNPDIQEILISIVEKQPPEMHLVVSGRVDPPWPLARWRVGREITEIRTQQLRFSLEESGTLLNDVMNLDLSAEEISKLGTKTEGWAAGLLMAAISLQGRDKPADFIQAFEGSHRFIFDYLVEEVLNHLPPEIQDFLLKTSILKRMCAPLCDAVLGRDDCQSVLRQLENLNLFIFPLDDRRYWYRYHRLFSDLLTNRLYELQPEKVIELHRRARDWYESHHYLPEAVNHAFAAGDIREIVRLIETRMQDMLESGEVGLLSQWVDKLPEETIEAHPWLGVAQAWSLALAGSLEAAVPSLTSVEAALRENDGMPDSQKRHITGHVAAIRCYIGIFSGGDHSHVTALAQQALENLPDTDMRTRGMVSVYLAVMQRVQRNYESALETLNSALTIYRATHQTYVIIDILSQIARIRREQGRLHETAKVCQEALEISGRFAKDGQHRLPIAAYAMGVLGRIYYEWNQLDKAEEVGLQALKLSERWGQANTLLGNHLFLARVYRVQGEYTRALTSIRLAESIGGRFSESHAFVIRAHEMMIQLALGNIDAVEQWVLNESGAFEINQDDKLWELAPLILALYGKKRITTLDPLLAAMDRFLDIYEEKGIWRRYITAAITKAMVFEALKDHDRALESLQQALSHAESEGYTRSFIDQGAPMGNLLELAIVSGIRTAYSTQLLSQLKAEVHTREIQSSTGAYHDPLTERENEVLRHLDTDLSIPEIASKLVISPGTLRTHIKRIYTKLGVHSRFEATTRAREYHLLDATEEIK